MTEISLIERAVKIAIVAHGNQKRKHDGFPYIVHPFMVANILTRYGFPDEVVAAGLVHDVVEDTSVTLDELRRELGDTVADIVAGVSEQGKEHSWEDRKRGYIEVIRGGSEGVKAVSLADKIHNLTNMLAASQVEGEEFWAKFSRGRAEQQWFAWALLEMYKETWNHPMVEEYECLVAEFSAI